MAKWIRDQIWPETHRSSLEALFEHFEQRARPPSHRELSEGHVLALAEGAHLRLTLTIEGYVEWLALMARPYHDAARHSVLEFHGEVHWPLGKMAWGPSIPQRLVRRSRLALLLPDMLSRLR